MLGKGKKKKIYRKRKPKLLDKVQDWEVVHQQSTGGSAAKVLNLETNHGSCGSNFVLTGEQIRIKLEGRMSMYKYRVLNDKACIKFDQQLAD